MVRHAWSYELMDSVDDPSDALQYDGGANAETWNDPLRLRREDLEPQRFSRISCPVLPHASRLYVVIVPGAEVAS